MAKSGVVEDGADGHGFGDGVADSGSDGRGEVGDEGELSGALVEVTGYEGGAGGDDLAFVAAGVGDDVKGDGGAAVDDDGGRTDEDGGPGRVGEAIVADLGGGEGGVATTGGDEAVVEVGVTQIETEEQGSSIHELDTETGGRAKVTSPAWTRRVRPAAVRTRRAPVSSIPRAMPVIRSLPSSRETSRSRRAS